MSASIPIAELLEKTDRGDPLLLFDVRNDEEFERWRVEGRRPVNTFHRPYFDYIEDESLLDQVPRDAGEIFVLCAKGDSSDLIADMLHERGTAARNVAGGMIAYGESLLPVRVPLDPGESSRFEIWQMNRRGKGCLSYVIRSGEDAVVIDPSRNIGEYERFVEKLGARIIGVFDTHVHADHISGGPMLAPRHNARYSVAGNNGEEILGLRILKTPGHTPDSTSFLIGKNHLLTGDTIFVASVGRPDLGGQVVEWGKMLFHTLNERIAALPDDVVILPAHYASANEIGADGVVSGRLGTLRQTVPELQIRSESEFVDVMKAALKSHPDVYDKIIGVNLGLQTVDEQTAGEWELGKNECAAHGGSR